MTRRSGHVSANVVARRRCNIPGAESPRQCSTSTRPCLDEQHTNDRAGGTWNLGSRRCDTRRISPQQFRIRSRTRKNRERAQGGGLDRKSTRLNSSHVDISYAVFCLKKKKQ